MMDCGFQYAKVLFELGIDEDLVNQSFQGLIASNELTEVLDDPSIKGKVKHRIIDRLFDKKIASFFKVVCDNFRSDCFKDIYDEYKNLSLNKKNGIRAKVTFAKKPEESQKIQEIKNLVSKKYNKDLVEIDVEENQDLIGGFILNVGDDEYDRSVKGIIENLKNKFAK